MKTTLWLLPLIIVVIGCAQNPTVNEKESVAQDVIQQNLNSKVGGAPNITNGTDKLTVKKIYEKRDQANLITYVYSEDMVGILHFRFRAKGYPTCLATQWSAPTKWTYGGSTRGYYQEPQAEPNGIYPPATSEGDYILAIDENNPSVDHLVFFEPRWVVYDYPVSYLNQTPLIVDGKTLISGK